MHGHVNKRDIAKHHSTKMFTTIDNPISSATSLWEPPWYSVLETQSPLSPKSPAVGISANPCCNPEGDLRLFFQKQRSIMMILGDGGTPLQTQKITLHCLLDVGTMCGSALTSQWSCDLRSSKDWSFVVRNIYSDNLSEIWGDVSNLSVLFSNILFLSSDLSLTVLCCFRFYFCRIYLILDLKKIGFSNYIRQVLSSAWRGGSIFFMGGRVRVDYWSHMVQHFDSFKIMQWCPWIYCLGCSKIPWPFDL